MGILNEPQQAMAHAMQAEQPFPVLRLPREVRDMIWRFALLKPKIVVDFSRDWVFNGFRKPTQYRTKLEWDEMEKTDKDEEKAASGSYHRLLWGHVHGAKSAVGMQDQGDDPFFGHKYDSENLNLLLTSRQVYAEAASVYYSENCFVFTGTGNDVASVLAAYAFLKDRSPSALKRIRHIELQLGDVYKEQMLSSLVYSAWKPLMTIIKSSMNLWSLHLNFGGRVPELRHRTIDKARDLEGNPCPWVSDLCHLPKLKRLEISVCTQRDDLRHHPNSRADEIRRTVSFMRTLRGHMLTNGDRLGYDNIRVRLRHHRPVNHITQYYVRKGDRILTFECDDDEKGTSYLTKEVHHARPNSKAAVQEHGPASGAQKAVGEQALDSGAEFRRINSLKSLTGWREEMVEFEQPED